VLAEGDLLKLVALEGAEVHRRPVLGGDAGQALEENGIGRPDL
jgi:hypothetical protein